jgi:hypothetical protein
MPNKLNIASALSAANEVRSGEGEEEVELERKAKPVSLRISEADHNRFRSLFAKSGLNLSQGCIASITYVVELIEAGVFTISKAGVQDIRGRKGGLG